MNLDTGDNRIIGHHPRWQIDYGAPRTPLGSNVFDLLKPEPWMQQAVCPQADVEAWFPEKGGSTKAAKSICKSCPVTAECLQYALDHDERFGIWGGLSERERRHLRRERNHYCAECGTPLPIDRARFCSKECRTTHWSHGGAA